MTTGLGGPWSKQRDRDPNGPDGEVMLDIEVAGAIAPRAKIIVYFAPDTDVGFPDAISTAVHDAKNKPSSGDIRHSMPPLRRGGGIVIRLL